MVEIRGATITHYVKLNTTGLETAKKKADDNLKGLSTRLQDVGTQARNAGTSLSLLVSGPLIALGVASFGAAVKMDSLKRGLTAVSGSAQETERQLVRLKEVAKLPGLGFREAIEGSINLQAAGFSAQMAEKSLMAFGNALATVGKGKAELDRVNLALTQLINKQSGFGQDIRQLQEALPQIRQALIAAFGTGDTEIIGKMGVTGQQVVERLIAQFAKLPLVTGGIQNDIENFQDAAYRALTAIGKAVLPVASEFLNNLTPAIESSSKAFSELPTFAQKALGGLAAGGAIIGPAIYGLGLLLDSIGKVKAGLATISIGKVGSGFVIALAAAAGLELYAKGSVQSAGRSQYLIDKENRDYLERAKAQGPEAYEKAKRRIVEGSAGYARDMRGMAEGRMGPANVYPIYGPDESKKMTKEEQDAYVELEFRVRLGRLNDEYDKKLLKAKQTRDEDKKINEKLANEAYMQTVKDVEKDRADAQAQAVEDEIKRRQQGFEQLKGDLKREKDAQTEEQQKQNELSLRALEATQSKDAVARRKAADQYYKDLAVDQIAAFQVFQAAMDEIDKQIQDDLRKINKELIELEIDTLQRARVDFEHMTFDTDAKDYDEEHARGEGGPGGGMHPRNIRRPGVGFLTPSPEAQADIDATQRATDEERAANRSIKIWQHVGREIENSLASGFKAALHKGLRGFQEFFSSILDAFENMLAQMVAKWLAKQAIMGIASAFGAPAGLLGALGFDDPVNDATAGRWGRDFGKHFSMGALESASRMAVAGAGAASGSTVVINLGGTYHIREEADISKLADGLAVEIQRRSRVRF